VENIYSEDKEEDDNKINVTQILYKSGDWINLYQNRNHWHEVAEKR
jgi:hypothetical protein